MRNIFEDPGAGKLALAIIGTGLFLTISEAFDRAAGRLRPGGGHERMGCQIHQ